MTAIEAVQRTRKPITLSELKARAEGRTLSEADSYFTATLIGCLAIGTYPDLIFDETHYLDLRPAKNNNPEFFGK